MLIYLGYISLDTEHQLDSGIMEILTSLCRLSRDLTPRPPLHLKRASLHMVLAAIVTFGWGVGISFLSRMRQ